MSAKPANPPRAAVQDPDGTGALILGTNYRALGVVRSLGRRGIPVRIVKTDDAGIASFSRYARQPLQWTAGGADAQLEHLLRLISRHGLEGWTAIPTDDETMALVSRGREHLTGRCLVAAPEWESAQWAYDKRLTYRLGLELGIEQPRTWFAGDLHALEAVALDVPAILKPGIKRAPNRFIEDKAWPVPDRATLKARYDAARALVPADEIMLQELIPGDASSQLSYAALARQGHVLASITAWRARQHPMDFGRLSTYVESIDAPDVAEAARLLIEGMSYTGLVEIEFKRDARDGRPKLLDINPRVWGWHSIGARAGVDFPYLEWEMIHDRPVAEAHAPPGIRWVRMSTDVPTAAREVLGGRMSLHDYLESLRGPIEDAMLCRDDPLPAFADVPLLALVHLRRRLRGLRRAA